MDHVEAESELVAGHLVEFGGRMLLAFFICEYAHVYFCLFAMLTLTWGGLWVTTPFWPLIGRRMSTVLPAQAMAELVDATAFGLVALAAMAVRGVLAEADIARRDCTSPTHVIAAVAASHWAVGGTGVRAHAAPGLGAVWAGTHFGTPWV